MTFRTPTSTELRPSTENVASSRHDVAPYARPLVDGAPATVDAMLIDAIRAATGPYVAASWRVPTQASAAPIEHLPSPVVVREASPLFAVAPSSVPTPMSSATITPIMPTPIMPTPIIPTPIIPTPIMPTPVSTHPLDELPWIDAFMDSGAEASATPEATERDASSPQAAVDGADVQPIVSIESLLADATDISAPDTNQESFGVRSVVESSEEWPLDEAGEAMRGLVEGLGTPESSGSPIVQPLPMWSDDDVMDIMPVTLPETLRNSQSDARSTASNATTGERDDHWAARAQDASERSSDVESAARVLESLAKRVRDGELQIPGYSTEMSDAATVAAALSALLGTRR